jgi:hypothetical protein
VIAPMRVINVSLSLDCGVMEPKLEYRKVDCVGRSLRCLRQGQVTCHKQSVSWARTAMGSSSEQVDTSFV